MWLINSSIGRKVIMSVSGAMLLLFLLFHGAMNFVVLFSQEAYNAICAFLGANWYALIATKGLAIGFAVHILFALFLSYQNLRARGNIRYEVKSKPKLVDWASQNMFILGIIVLGFLVTHLYQFWSRMQFVEIQHKLGIHVDEYFLDHAANGAYWVHHWFSQPIYSIVYIVWLSALWLHLTHGVWSALHSLGLNNTLWMKRIKVFSYALSTVIILMFMSIPIYFLLGFGKDWIV